MSRQPGLYLRPLEPGDDVRRFTPGNDPEFLPLKDFIRRKAKKLHAANVARTYVLVDASDDAIKGYITLVCSEIARTDENTLDDCQSANHYSTFPAVKIARLAISSSAQGRRYGSELLDWCIAHVVDNVMPMVGCRFLVVDSKPSAVGFYDKYGFTRLGSQTDGAAGEDDHPVFFIDLHKLLEQAAT